MARSCPHHSTYPKGSRGLGRTPLDWDHRLRISLSAARGVTYLHVAGKVVHGNIKSSNILLRQDSNKDASVCDFQHTLWRVKHPKHSGHRLPCPGSPRDPKSYIQIGRVQLRGPTLRTLNRKNSKPSLVR